MRRRGNLGCLIYNHVLVFSSLASVCARQLHIDRVRWPWRHAHGDGHEAVTGWSTVVPIAQNTSFWNVSGFTSIQNTIHAVTSLAPELAKLVNPGGGDIFFRSDPKLVPQSRGKFKTNRSVPLYVTIDTRDHRQLIPMPGVPGITWENIGSGQAWELTGSKLVILWEWLQRPDLDPESLVVYTDTDVAYGGCSQQDLVDRYSHIVQTSGHGVVFSAELGLTPYSSQVMWDMYAALDDRFRAGMRAFGLEPDAYSQASYCRDPEYVDNFISYAPCSTPPMPKFLNSGFMMGKVRDLRLAFVDPSRPQCGRGIGGDQCYWTMEYLRKSGNITLDYSFALSMSLFGLTHEAIDVRDGVLFNSITNKSVCFAHFNGAIKRFMDNVLKANRSAWVSHIDVPPTRWET